jgi:transglutaminase-like putative cysteine protease
MARTLPLCAVAGAVLAWCWLRLETARGSAWQGIWLIALGVLPMLLPRRSWRLAALVPAAVLAAHAAFGVWLPLHPLRLLARFGHGFLEFYDVRLPFSAAAHPRMSGVVLIALFASAAALALAVAARRPVTAALVVVVAAGWPATLLSGPDDLSRGAAILAVALALLVGLDARVPPRRLMAAAVVGAAVVFAALGVSRSSAVASGQVLRWQNWDFYTKPEKPVGVEYVWSSNYGGLHFPKKITPVLRIKAPDISTYWRATTLDEFDGGNWYELPHQVGAITLNGRDELVTDPEAPPAAAENEKRWIRQEVTDLALHDNHLIGASVPIAYTSGTHAAQYATGGVAYIQGRPLSPGDHYTVWSYQAQPTPQELARLKPRYPRIVRDDDLYVEAREVAPPFGSPNRDALLRQLFATSFRAREYEGLYDTAKRVVGRPRNPYAAALELEGWFRSGAFRYDETPPASGNTPALVDFVMRTHRGYCQHFAGAMALMLRYLGIPARVAAGFTSGTYDPKKHEWTVTDHDAHTWVEAWFPRYGWLPFDPTPGRGNLDGSYTSSSPHFDLSDGLRAVSSALGAKGGGFDLRKLRSPQARAANAPGQPVQRKGGSSSGRGLGALVEVLLLAGAALAAAVVALKLGIRKRRYLTRDPRRLAAASLRELADFVTDQGAAVPPSATVWELGEIVDNELGVRADDFVVAAAAARYGPADGAGAAARDARRELRALRHALRRSLTRSERALGLVSLRSLGLTG